MNFLAKIVARKLEDSLRLFESGVAEAFKADIARRPAPLSLKAALDGATGPAIIAEVKRASPSKGEFALHWDPVELAQIYQDHGAAAISVLTETHYFKGDPEFIRRMRPVIRLPILRKDFIVEPIQVYESAALGADALLLIVSLLESEAAPGPAAPDPFPGAGGAGGGAHRRGNGDGADRRGPGDRHQLPESAHLRDVSGPGPGTGPPGAAGGDPGGRLGDQDPGRLGALQGRGHQRLSHRGDAW